MDKFNIYGINDKLYRFNSEEDADKYVELVNMYKYHNQITPETILKEFFAESEWEKEDLQQEVIDIPTGDIPDEFKNLYMVKNTPNVGFFMNCIYTDIGDKINKEIEELKSFYIATTNFTENIHDKKGSLIAKHFTGDFTFEQNITTLNFKLASIFDPNCQNPKYNIYMSVTAFHGGIYNVVFSYIMNINYFREEYSGKNKADLAEICKKKCSLIPINFEKEIIHNLTKCKNVYEELNSIA